MDMLRQVSLQPYMFGNPRESLPLGGTEISFAGDHLVFVKFAKYEAKKVAASLPLMWA